MVLARPPLALRPRSYEDLALTNYSGPSWSSYPSHHISRWTPGLAELAGRGGILDEGHIARLVRSSPLIRGPLPIAPSRLENAIFDILAVGEHEENEASKHLLLTNMLNKLRLADMHRPLRSRPEVVDYITPDLCRHEARILQYFGIIRDNQDYRDALQRPERYPDLRPRSPWDPRYDAYYDDDEYDGHSSRYDDEREIGRSVKKTVRMCMNPDYARRYNDRRRRRDRDWDAWTEDDDWL
ncbi:hypothetical protein H2203_001965 [Taxawa tesnikishii (nom. ined.)]|nr:hypothetical protein H2203_001965 [Dothideales sp. JES 119]